MSAQRPYIRTNPDGRRHVYRGSRAWTAEDYDLIEHLISRYGLPPRELRFYFEPVPTALAVNLAMGRAGIPLANPGPGRPSFADLGRWKQIRRELLTEEQYARSIQIELEEAVRRWTP